MWPECCRRGIAAIAYYDARGEPVVGDCRELTEEEYDEAWRQRRPRSGSARASLRYVAYRMKKPDIIYVKQGPWIVGKGEIVKPYDYDPRILEGAHDEWEHFVRVDWESDFPTFRLVLGADLAAVLRLDGERLRKIRQAESDAREKAKAVEAEEGARYTTEATFRARNRALIEAKKASSDYRCDVCGMGFEDVYGPIGREHIVAHHKYPIGRRKCASKTTMHDIALVCDNCHAMLHREDPPLSIGALRRRLRARYE